MICLGFSLVVNIAALLVQVSFSYGFLHLICSRGILVVVHMGLVARSVWNLPGPEMEPVSLSLVDKFLTTDHQKIHTYFGTSAMRKIKAHLIEPVWREVHFPPRFPWIWGRAGKVSRKCVSSKQPLLYIHGISAG